MDRAHILIVDLDPEICSVQPCQRLSDVMQDVFPRGRVTRHTSLAVLRDDGGPSPAVILFRPGAATTLPVTLDALRQQWAGASILGLFCNRPRSSGELLDSLLNGMDDFLSCPFDEQDLAARVQYLLHRSAGSAPVPPLPTEERRFGPLIGNSPCFHEVLRKVPLLARSDATVLITGETGTGKDLVARAIHYQSPRHGRPFIPVNCGALPDHLCENELFGHAKGAYTDASSSEKGLVAEAEGGTLFLDEVETLSLSAQAKLLRFLQDREYRPLGSSKGVIADVRILAATNRDLQRQVLGRQFREDLYYRLNVLSLTIPPLRDRLEDIPLLANHFLARYAVQYRRSAVTLSPGAIRKLMACPWPGNVRELEGIVQRALILCTTATIEPDDLDLSPGIAADPAEGGSLRDAKTRTIGQFERAYLANLLRSHHGNITQAARAAGKERRTFQRLLQKYGLERSAFTNPA